MAGRYVYVVDWTGNKLDIFDESNPTSPSLAGSVSTGSSSNPQGVYVQGHYAYVVDGTTNKLQVFDVSNPASPVSLGTVTSGTDPFDVMVVGRYAYVLDESGDEFQIFDMGGTYSQQLQAGGIETGTLEVDNNASIQNNLDVRGGLEAAGGANIQGDLSVTDANATTGTALNVSANSLTTGYGASITSTSTVQTAGSLLNVSDTAQLTTGGSSITGTIANVSRSITANAGGSGTNLRDPRQPGILPPAPAPTVRPGRTISRSQRWPQRLLLDGGRIFDDGSCSAAPTSVKHNGTSMTLITSEGVNGNAGTSCFFQYGLVAPTTGNNSILVTDATSSIYTMTADSWYNVNQSTPYGTAEKATQGGGSSTSAPTITYASWPAGRLIVDHTQNYDPTCNIAPSAGQTLITYSCQNTADKGFYGGNNVSSKPSTGSSLTMSWTGGPGVNSGNWATIAVDLEGDSTTNTSVTGNVATFSDNCTVSTGFCTDAGNVMSLQQQYANASGTVLSIQNAGDGDMIDLNNGSGKVIDKFTAGGSLTIGGGLTTGTVTDIETGIGSTYTESTPATGYDLFANDGTLSAGSTTTFNVTGVSNTEGAIVFIASTATKNAGSFALTLIVQINGTQISSEATSASSGSQTISENYIAMYINSKWRIIGYGNTQGATNTTTSDTADYAEYIDYSGDTAPQPGDVLIVGDTDTSVKDSTTPYDNHVIGVVSTTPYDVASTDDGHSVVLALTGRVPVKVSLENGPIELGDPLTSSSTPGVAMKATAGGQIIGTALGNYDGTQSSNEITVQLHVGYDDPDPGTIQGDESISGGLYIGGNANVSGNLTVAGTTTTQNLSVSGTANLATLTVSGSVTASSVTVSGQVSTATLMVSGAASFGGDITLSGHFITGGTTPTPAVNTTVAGSTATCTVVGNDTSGTITLQSQGTGQAVGSTVCHYL